MEHNVFSIPGFCSFGSALPSIVSTGCRQPTSRSTIPTVSLLPSGTASISHSDCAKFTQQNDIKIRILPISSVIFLHLLYQSHPLLVFVYCSLSSVSPTPLSEILYTTPSPAHISQAYTWRPNAELTACLEYGQELKFSEFQNFITHDQQKLQHRVLWKSVKAYAHMYAWRCMPSVLWPCSLGSRKGIRPVKNWVVRCWHGYLTGARCRLAYGPMDATATHCLLLQ